MSLRTVRCALAREVRTASSRVVFDLAARSRPELAALGDPTAAMTALRDQSQATLEARERILAAIVREHQTDAQPVWGALLLAAYSPMLTLLRARVRSDSSPDDLDQMVVAAFLEAASRVRIEVGRISVRLRSATQRTVFRALGRESRQARLVDCRIEDGASQRSPIAPAEAVASALDAFIDQARPGQPGRGAGKRSPGSGGPGARLGIAEGRVGARPVAAPVTRCRESI